MVSAPLPPAHPPNGMLALAERMASRSEQGAALLCSSKVVVTAITAALAGGTMPVTAVTIVPMTRPATSRRGVQRGESPGATDDRTNSLGDPVFSFARDPAVPA